MNNTVLIDLVPVYFRQLKTEIDPRIINNIIIMIQQEIESHL